MSKYTKANVLSFVDVDDMYDVTYSKGDAFVVHTSDIMVEFKHRESCL